MNLTFDQATLQSVPHFSQFLGDWAMHPEHLRGLADLIRSIDLGTHLAKVEAGDNVHVRAGSGGDYFADYTRVHDGIAIVNCAGPMMKHRASMSANVSTVAMRRSIRLAANDATIRGIMIKMDSPGGTVAGTADLAADIASAAKAKPVHGYADDMAASACYWALSQCLHLSAGPTSLIGSIGTYGVIEDFSKAAEQLGIKVHLVKAGEFKGTGVPGTEVTDEQLAYIQDRIDGANEHFLKGVAAGRSLTKAQVKTLNDGRVHLAAVAKDLQLIDAVESFDQAFDRLNKATTKNRGKMVMNSSASSDVASTMAAAAAASTDGNGDDNANKTEPTKPTTTPAAGGDRAELQRYMSTFGDAAGAKYFADELDYTAACEAHIAELNKQIATANERANEAEQKLSSLELGETEAVDTGAPAESNTSKGWAGLFKEAGTTKEG